MASDHVPNQEAREGASANNDDHVNRMEELSEHGSICCDLLFV
jgi:hypothetical protein